MSEIIEAEWWTGATGTVGAVLVHNEHDGFKVYIGCGAAHAEKRITIPEAVDRRMIYKYGAKMPFIQAAGIFGKRMKGENIRRNLRGDHTKLKYDGVEYNVAEMGEL